MIHRPIEAVCLCCAAILTPGGPVDPSRRPQGEQGGLIDRAPRLAAQPARSHGLCSPCARDLDVRR